MTTKVAERPTTVENIQVLQVGKYGVRVDEKTWFGVNEPLTPSHFVPDTGYKVAVSTSKTGKKYISEIIGQEEKQGAPAESAPAATPDPVKEAEAALAKAKATAEAKAKETPATTAKLANPSRAGFGQPLTDYDLKVQRQISRAGVWQAAAQAPITGMATNVEEYLSFVRRIADAGMQYVGE